MKAFRLDLTPEQAEALAEELQGLVEIGLDHPSIVMPLAAGLEGHTVYLAEEYVAAESLDIALRHYAPAGLERALPFLSQLAGAVDFARARGVGHGALHPRDIFLAPEVARATGFGIVQAIERLGLRAPVRRPYSAPERVSGGAWSTPADVFALGAVAHELLTGKRPAGTGEVAAIVGRAAESHPELLRAVLGRALAEDSAARYASARELVAAFEAAARGKGDAPAPELGDFTIRPVDEEQTFEVGREEDAPREERIEIEAHSPATAAAEEVEEEEQPAHEPASDKASGPTDIVAAPQRESRHRPSVSHRRKRQEREREIAEKEETQEPRVTEEPSLFDLGEQAPPAEVVAPDRFAQGEEWAAEAQREEAIEGPEELIEGSGEAIGGEEAADRVPVDDLLAPSERGYAPAEPVALSARSTYTSAGAERSRPAILPFAIVAMVALFAGFLAGYALGSREQKPSPAETVQSAPAVSTTPPAASSPAPSPSRGSSRPAPAATPPPSPPQKAWSEAAVEPAPAPSLPRGPVAPRVAVPAPRRTPAPPAATTGTVVADSRPSGARVVIDGRAVGKTPFKLTGMKAGLHTVRFELEGYRAWTTEITVTGGRETRVAGSLERIRSR